ncbi:MAG TPA: DegT/DnrJ/EryC1/StrS family aminotransferase [Thermomicrobiales bacterium]|nr:DegT/DnrJ/EryC1/StrS family aminotransferase [Thermomicrobiales bacterium]
MKRARTALEGSLAGDMNQRNAPFLDALATVMRSDAAPFSTPGHKRGRGTPDSFRAVMGGALSGDVPHAGGVDTTHLSRGLLRQAERLAAGAYGGDEARFLVNGSTTGNCAMLLATCGTGDIVIVSRTLHTSLLAGIIFSGARPVYVEPDIEPERNLPLDIPAHRVQAALAKHPSARAVVLVSPSYVGVTSDLVAIAAICHQAGVPLLVDEAWGPHFHFHPALPRSAMQSGADAAVSSTHKMLSALTQGSTLVARDGVLDLGRLNTAVDMLQTTSPSALIFASLDASRRQMALDGERLLTQAIEHALWLRGEIAGIEGLATVGPEMIAGRPEAGSDPTRVLIDMHGLGLTGYEAERVLRDAHGVYVEMSDLLSVMLLVTIGDSAQSVDRAARAFRALAGERGEGRHNARSRSSGRLLLGGEQAMTPREAFLAPMATVPVEQADGRISAEAITPYPPGIPLVTPGERLTREAIDYLRGGIAEGMYVSGLSDATFQTVRVVK